MHKTLNIFFCSDTHFGHKNIVKPGYGERPWASIEEHDLGLIQNWNSVVEPEDVVYFLGDLALCSPYEALEKVSLLEGRKRWILGNHDYEDKVKTLGPLFEWVKTEAQIRVPDVQCVRGYQEITLHHFPWEAWNKNNYGTWMLHGHCHGKRVDNPKLLRIDVGVDCHDFKPISYEQVKEIMSRKEWTLPEFLRAKEETE